MGQSHLTVYPEHNPAGGGMAAVFAAFGAAMGGHIGESFVGDKGKPSRSEVIAARDHWDAEAKAEWRAWTKRVYTIKAIASVIGAGLGAAVGAPSGARLGAVVGAVVGTGVMRASNVVRNPAPVLTVMSGNYVEPDGGAAEMPGVLTGAAGAYVGVRAAGR